MELQVNRPMMFERRPFPRSRAPACRWVKEWVTQDLVSTGGKVRVHKWIREDKFRAIQEKGNGAQLDETEPEPTTEVLFLCSYEGCGKTFIDAGALRKHSHIHGERQHVCTVPGCGKKFLDSSKLKRHNLSHTGEKRYICPHEGCNKAFSLDFNLRSHMKTHSQENYHICPYGDCGKKFAHDYKLQSHIKTHHEKSNAANSVKHTSAEKLHSAQKAPAAVYGSDRPYVCSYEGCGKAYIHEYKLNLHLKKEHPDHQVEENGRRGPVVDHEFDEASEHDTYIGKNAYSCPYEGCGKSYIHEYKLNLHLKKTHPNHSVEENGKRLSVVDYDDETGEHDAYPERNGFGCPFEGCGKSYIHEYKLNLHLRKEHSAQNLEEIQKHSAVLDHEVGLNEYNAHVGKNSGGKSLKRSKPNFSAKTQSSKVARSSPSIPTNVHVEKENWPEEDEEDSEETEEEDHENVDDDGWRYQGINEDDEETEDED